MTSVFIDGGHGTTGLQIHDRLAGRDEISLITLDEARRKDLDARREAINDADVVILCLPDDAAREAVTLISNDRTCVIDASTAHRVATGWAYGFPEYRTGQYEAVRTAKRISNPGCYSTGFIALLAPLVDAGLVDPSERYSCHAVSGYSGGGKSMIAEFETTTPPTAWRTYATSLAHKHVPEMTERVGLVHRPIFTPSVANTHSGMIVEVPLHRPSGDAAKLHDCLATHYAKSPLISVVTETPELLSVERLAGTDRMELFVFANADGTQARLVAALDNLGKGASGAAVQSLNLVSGLDELAGLRL